MWDRKDEDVDPFKGSEKESEYEKEMEDFAFKQKMKLKERDYIKNLRKKDEPEHSTESFEAKGESLKMKLGNIFVRLLNPVSKRVRIISTEEYEDIYKKRVDEMQRQKRLRLVMSVNPSLFKNEDFEEYQRIKKLLYPCAYSLAIAFVISTLFQYKVMVKRKVKNLKPIYMLVWVLVTYAPTFYFYVKYTQTSNQFFSYVSNKYQNTIRDPQIQTLTQQSKNKKPFF
jgi:hypothetical protein